MANILLADDDAATRELVKRALAADGHVVLVTQDGAEALEQFEAHAGAIDVIVSDVDMPLMDGITLAEKVLERKPSVAIVLMSGFADQLGRAKSLPQSRLTSITKPFSLDQIKQAVRAVLG